MKIKTLLLLLTGISITGCGKNRAEQETPVRAPERDSSSASEIKVLQNNDTLIITDQVHMLRFRKPVKAVNFLKINNKKPQVYTLRLQPQDALGNIRFSQLIMPDGTSDGPFGNEMTYNLEFSGTYYIKISENMMSGEPWGGDVVLTIKRK